jgi:hypothetical protein
MSMQIFCIYLKTMEKVFRSGWMVNDYDARFSRRSFSPEPVRSIRLVSLAG